MTADALPQIGDGAGCTVITALIDPATMRFVPTVWIPGPLGGEDLGLTITCNSETPLVTPPEYGHRG
ncbi:MAG: hypothetical protein KDA35_10690, partial [Hyphomonadaceae bacterium]|nr:hypothetical protein [Hyphomonadaceae bacterium]